MTDLRDPVRDDLDAMFRRREGDVVGPPRMPASSRRRAHRRQAGTAALAVAGLAAVVALTVAGIQAFDGDDRFVPAPREEHTRPVFERTATIEGFTLTSPSDWYLVDYWPVMGRAAAITEGVERGEAVPGSEWIPGAAGVPVLQLTSYDPGLGTPICGSPTGDDPFPSDGVGLYIGLDTASKVDPEEFVPWPNTLTVEPPACEGGTELHFGVRRGGRVVPYLLWYGAGPDASDADRAQLDAIVEAFAVDADQQEIHVPGTDTPGFVLWGGTNEDGSTWTIEARPAEVNIDLKLVTRELGGTYSEGGFGDFDVPPKDVEGGFMGVVNEQAERVEFVPSDGSAPAMAQLSDLPASLGYDADAYYFPEGYPTKDEPADGEAVAVMPDGPPEETDAPRPPAVYEGELARGTWLGGTWVLVAGSRTLELYDGMGDLRAIEWYETEPPGRAFNNVTLTAELDGRVETLVIGTVRDLVTNLGVSADDDVLAPVVRGDLPPGVGHEDQGFYVVVVPGSLGGFIVARDADCADLEATMWQAVGVGATEPVYPSEELRAAVCDLPASDPSAETAPRPSARITTDRVVGVTTLEPVRPLGLTWVASVYPVGDSTCGFLQGPVITVETCGDLQREGPAVDVELVDDAGTAIVYGVTGPEVRTVQIRTADGGLAIPTRSLETRWGGTRYVLDVVDLGSPSVPVPRYLDANGEPVAFG